VIPSARGRGVFTALYEHVEALARATAGVIGLRLYVEGDNTRAQRSYARCGMALRDYRFMEVDYSGALDRAKEE
jgi:ribosomal protein S18 acetylase RimI-like enzyme